VRVRSAGDLRGNHRDISQAGGKGTNLNSARERLRNNFKFALVSQGLRPNLTWQHTMTSPGGNDISSPAFKKARKQYIKSTSNRDANIELDWSAFRTAEKRYKSRFPPPDLSDALDLATLDESRSDEYTKGGWFGRSDAVEVRQVALKIPDGACVSSDSKAYMIPQIPGAKDSRNVQCGLGTHVQYIVLRFPLRTCCVAIVCFPGGAT
jgi:hypothetical protein